MFKAYYDNWNKTVPKSYEEGKGQQLPLFCSQEGFRKANIEVFTNNRLIM